VEALILTEQKGLFNWLAHFSALQNFVAAGIRPISRHGAAQASPLTSRNGRWQAAQHGRQRQLRTGSAVIRRLSFGGSRKDCL